MRRVISNNMRHRLWRWQTQRDSNYE